MFFSNLIGHPRKLKNCYEDNINEFSTNMVSIFNVEKATHTLSHESITLLTNDFKWLMDAIKQTRSFNDQEEEGRKNLWPPNNCFLTYWVIYTKTARVCQAEELIYPNWRWWMVTSKELETLNICEVLKKIKYKCSKLSESITKEEKETEIKRRSE